MTISILQPVKIADECSLYEALLWVAFNRFPIEDDNEEIDYIWNGDFSNRIADKFDYFFTDEICNKYGLPQNLNSINGSDYALEQEDLIRCFNMNLSFLDDNVRTDEEAKKKKAEDYLNKMKDFYEVLDSKIDKYRISLLAKLQSGEIQAKGIEGNSKFLMDFDSYCQLGEYKHIFEDYWFDKNIINIPYEAWITKHTSFTRNCLKYENRAFLNIKISTEKLINLFPSEKNSSITVGYVSGFYILGHRSSGQGRKSNINWVDFQKEVLRRYDTGDIPEKQLAFVADMKDWYKEKYGKVLSDASIIEKISPFCQHLEDKSKSNS